MPTDRRIFLGMPGYGNQTAWAGRAFWRCCRDMSSVTQQYQQGSLLAHGFNALWCTALNMAAEKDVTHFAMLHNDIGVDDFWLDKLIDELEAANLDVLGVVAPLKDTRGLTSLALHREGDNWRPLCRLSMHDVYQLPETFTSDDIGHPLLLNTGCWVCRFDHQWRTQVHFTINDRIVFDRATGKYLAETESEDWFFSRLLHEMGLRIGATRKIALLHQGDMMFPNVKAWGTHKCDIGAIDRSPVPNAFPAEIPGWLEPEEGIVLADLARGARVLEIGSYCGRSTVCLARTAEHVSAVDYFDGRATPEPRDTRAAFLANIERYGLSEKVTICNPDEMPPYGYYDLIFIDGAHDYQSVRADIHKCLPALAPGGLVVFHDYASGIDPGVTQAVDEFVAEGASIESVTHSMAVVRPPAALPMEV